MTDMEQAIRQQIEDSLQTKKGLLEPAKLVEVSAVATLLVNAYRQGNKLLLFGNGGSAADAQHIAAEFIGQFSIKGRVPLPALALTVNTSVLTTVANDIGYEAIFARQVTGLGQPGDVALGISTSGNSENVLEGIRAAKARGLKTAVLTGSTGGRIAQEAGLCIRVPSDNTQRIQEAHILIGHILCDAVEKALFGNEAIDR
jgi:D-sedoheptulose 7-phosphate isomerase